MIVIALTGSLATGKSTVSSLLSRPPYSLPIIDADIIAREVVEPGTWGYRRIVNTFSPDTPDLLLPASSTSSTGITAQNQGSDPRPPPLNRAALGRRVFGSTPSAQEARKRLNAIIHPLVRLRMLQLLLYYHIRGHWAVVLDVPLLYESRLDIFASVVIMVAVSDEGIQWRRLRERDKALSEKEARDRVGSQMSVREKVEKTLARASTSTVTPAVSKAATTGMRGKVIWNDGSREDLQREVKKIIAEIQEQSWGELWRWWLWNSPFGVALVVIWEILTAWLRRRSWEQEMSARRKTEDGEKDGKDKKG